jgi:hypothetical protein
VYLEKRVNLHPQIHELGEIIHTAGWYCRLCAAVFLEHLLDSVRLLRIFFAMFNSCLLINHLLSDGTAWSPGEAVNIRDILKMPTLYKVLIE